MKDSLNKEHRCYKIQNGKQCSPFCSLYPPALQALGLGPALQGLCGKLEEQHGLPLQCKCAPDLPRLPDELESMLYRWSRELLINAIKHGRPTSAGLTLSLEHEQLRLLVWDDGVGFNPEAVLTPSSDVQGLGLFSIREQVLALDGAMSIRLRPRTEVGLRLPWPAPSTSPIEHHEAPA